MEESLEDRLAALERAVTDGERDLSGLSTAAESGERIETLEADLSALEDRVAELEAATQALRGYVGNVRAVNEEVEQRADLALSKAEAAIERDGGDAPVVAPTSAGGATLDADAGTGAVDADNREVCPRCGAAETPGGEGSATARAAPSAQREVEQPGERGLLDRVKELL